MGLAVVVCRAKPRSDSLVFVGLRAAQAGWVQYYFRDSNIFERDGFSMGMAFNDRGLETDRGMLPVEEIRVPFCLELDMPEFSSTT